MDDQDERFMRSALDEAQAAFESGDVPVGAVAVHRGRIIGRGHNQRELLSDPTAHAEMLAITAAAEFLKSWRLVDCTLYVTLEPCVMCAGAIVQARVSRLVFPINSDRRVKFPWLGGDQWDVQYREWLPGHC